MRRSTVLAGIGVVLTVGLLLFAPFTRIHPHDPALEMGSVRHPVWSMPVDSYSDFKLNAGELVIEIVVVWVMVVGIEALLRAFGRR
jgi:hypothetical protein